MKKFYKIFLLLIIFFFLTTYNPNKFSITIENSDSFFSIKKIIILNNILVDKDDVYEKLDKLYGKSIFLIKREELEETLEDLAFSKKIEVKKKYPKTIKIKILETKPLGIIFKDKKKYLLDNSSNLIDLTKKKDLPKLPNIIGDGAEKNFVNFYEKLDVNKFPLNNIKKFYYFKVGRWDLELIDNKIIKYPYKINDEIIKKSIELLNRKDFQKYKIIDLRIDDKIIVE